MPEELICITDDQGELTGEKLPRSVVHEKKLWHRTSGVWIINDNKDLLCNLIAPNKEPGQLSRWATTVGGHLAEDENFLENAIRELNEEIGLVVKPEQLQHICTRLSSRYQHANGVFLLIWNGRAEDLKIDNVEIVDIKWVKNKDILELFEKKIVCNTLVPQIREYLKI